MESTQPLNVRPKWLSAITHPTAIRYLAFALMFAGLGSAVLYAQAATAPAPILGNGNTCLTSGSPVQMKACDNSAAQLWQFTQDGTIEQDGRCLDIERSIGLAALMNDCDGTKYQRWHQDDQNALINVANASCLQPAMGGEAGGSRSLVTAACSGSPNESWQTRQ